MATPPAVDDGEAPSYTQADMDRISKWFNVEPTYEEELKAMKYLAEFFDICEADEDEKITHAENLRTLHEKVGVDVIFNPVTCSNRVIFRRAAQQLRKYEFNAVPDVPRNAVCSRKFAHRLYPGDAFRDLRINADARINLQTTEEGTPLVKLPKHTAPTTQNLGPQLLLLCFPHTINDR